MKSLPLLLLLISFSINAQAFRTFDEIPFETQMLYQSFPNANFEPKTVINTVNKTEVEVKQTTVINVFNIEPSNNILFPNLINTIDYNNLLNSGTFKLEVRESNGVNIYNITPTQLTVPVFTIY